MMIETQSKQGEVERILISCLKQHPAGLTDSDLDTLLRPKGLTQQQIVDAINSLHSQSRLQALTRATDGEPVFKIVSEEQASRMRDLSYEEQLIYQVVSDAGSNGALAFQFRGVLGGLNQTKINALLRQMEKKGVIKSLKSVSKGNKKVYLLADIEPSIEVTGGLTGTSNFDLGLIEKVQQRVENHVRAKGTVTHRDLLISMKQSGLPADMVREEDIDQIITSMVLNMQLETVGASSAEPIYKAANWGYQAPVLVPQNEAAEEATGGGPAAAYLETPCAHCTLKNDCGPANEINPQTCEYMRNWLELF